MKCRICQSTNSKVIRDTLRYDVKRDVLQCLDCDFIYLADAKRGEYYSGQEYRKHYGPDLTRKVSCQEIFGTYLPAQGEMIKEIESILRPDMKVLDIGCSTGHFLTALKDLVGERVGLELGKDEVEFIRTNLDVKVYDQPIEEVKITEGPFDLITSFQVLEHIEEPQHFLEAIYRNLKPDGYLYLELPNLNDVLVSTYQVKGYIDFFYHEPHVSYFSEQTLKKLLHKVGFDGEVKTVQRYNILNHINWMLTGKPMDNFTLGNKTPELVTKDTVDKKIKKELNDFIQRTDKEYKELINKFKLGESLSFLGKKSK